MFKKSPIFFLLHKLPVIKMFYGYWKWIYLTIFSWAVLAGYGLDFLPQIKNSRAFRKFVSALKYSVAVIFGRDRFAVVDYHHCHSLGHL